MEQKIEVNFLENDKFEVNIGSSGKKFYIDKKAENYAPCGPNPLEVFLSSLGGCIGVYAKRYLQRHNLAFRRLSVGVTGELCQESPVRLINLKVNVDTDAELGDKKDVFSKFIENCPIHNTIRHTKEVDIRIG